MTCEQNNRILLNKMLFFVYYSITFILHSVEKYKLLVQLNWFFPVHFIHIPRSILELDVIFKDERLWSHSKQPICLPGKKF